MSISSRELGQAAEKRACQYLIAQGLILVATNYRCAMGEIDLIMRDGQQLVFIEVRQRNTLRFGGGIASVDKRKQSKLLRTAQHYLQQRSLTDKISCRFDVLALLGTQITWIQNAFMASG